MGVDVGSDFESVAKRWLSAKKYRTLNVLTTVVFWTLWKMRNNLCFQGLSWTGGHVLLRRSAKMLRLVPAKQARRCRQVGAVVDGTGE
jgi:hypothetical protein